MRQVETARTLVFDAPRHARGFFEALVTDNLDIGRPAVRLAAAARGDAPARPGLAWLELAVEEVDGATMFGPRDPLKGWTRKDASPDRHVEYPAA